MFPVSQIIQPRLFVPRFRDSNFEASEMCLNAPSVEPQRVVVICYEITGKSSTVLRESESGNVGERERPRVREN